jgi:hypothetical protein
MTLPLVGSLSWSARSHSLRITESGRLSSQSFKFPIANARAPSQSLGMKLGRGHRIGHIGQASDLQENRKAMVPKSMLPERGSAGSPRLAVAGSQRPRRTEKRASAVRIFSDLLLRLRVPLIRTVGLVELSPSASGHKHDLQNWETSTQFRPKCNCCYHLNLGAGGPRFALATLLRCLVYASPPVA